MNGESSMEVGQTTLESQKMVLNNGTNGFAHDGLAEDGEDGGAADPNAQLEMEIRGARTSTGPIMNGSPGQGPQGPLPPQVSLGPQAPNVPQDVEMQ